MKIDNFKTNNIKQISMFLECRCHFGFLPLVLFLLKYQKTSKFSSVTCYSFGSSSKFIIQICIRIAFHISLFASEISYRAKRHVVLGRTIVYANFYSLRSPIFCSSSLFIFSRYQAYFKIKICILT